jgi:hypothetical protein
MLRIGSLILTAIMPESSSYSTQHASRWLNMQLSSDSDLQYTSSLENPCQGSSAIQSSWLQLQLSSEDSSEVVSDIGYNQEDSVRSSSKRGLDDVDSSDSGVSQHDDLSDILEEYIQSHGLLSEIEDPLSQSDGDDSADDYQPGSAEEWGPTWIKTSQADGSARISEVEDNVESPGE